MEVILISSNIKPKEGAMVSLMTVIITQFVLNSIGLNKKTVGIFVTVVMVGCILFIVGIIKSGNKGFGIRINIAVSTIMLLTCILNVAMIIMIECFPDFGDTHKILAMALIFSAIASFFVLVVFLFIAYSIVMTNK